MLKKYLIVDVIIWYIYFDKSIHVKCPKTDGI